MDILFFTSKLFSLLSLALTDRPQPTYSRSRRLIVKAAERSGASQASLDIERERDRLPEGRAAGGKS